ncbi:MAG: type II toxin-antitoxin system VapC family toxin [Oscillospiraceae bacterium]|jgi:PIN domain nuclease of toxin-antitoxin system|nr:type II toxin-antitoxin system VapC family toxin [Oscillospiraceae bacterium]
MMENAYVLDACALIALLEKEDGANVVLKLYNEAKTNRIKLMMSKLNLLEVYYGTLRDYGLDQAHKLIESISKSPIQIVSDFSDEVFVEAGRLKASYKISLADSIALAEAAVRQALLVTCDHHEFDIIEQNEPIKFLWIR